MALLEVQGLRVSYRTARGPVRAVDGATFALEEGQALGLVGESGSGKSSLALALMGMLPGNADPPSGSVRLEGQEVLGLEEGEFRRRYRGSAIAMAFQGAMNSLNPVMKVGHQIAEPLLLERATRKAAAHARVRDLLEMVGLAQEVFHRYPHELSGGMKQRAVLAMALARSPRLVILDEPTSALDVSVQAQVMNLLKRLKRDLGLSMVFITHDIALSSDICDRLAVMYAGQVVEAGDIEGVLERPGHPYSRLLLESIPRLRGGVRPASIPGAPPDPAAMPPGCRFHPRCPLALERCSAQAPPAFPAGRGDHQACCWLLERG